MALQPGTWTLTVAQVGRAATQQEVTVEAGDSQTLDLALGDAELVQLSGSVTDRDGAPIAGAEVTLPERDLAASTDEQGEWALPDVPAGRGSCG